MSNVSNPRTNDWIKARLSGGSANCVEMRRDAGAVQVRDSKHVEGDILDVSPAQFAAWVGAARRGEFPLAH